MFFEKASKQSKFQRTLTNVIIVYLVVHFSNSFIFKLEWIHSIMAVTDIVLFAVVLTWLVFFVKNEE